MADDWGGFEEAPKPEEEEEVPWDGEEVMARAQLLVVLAVLVLEGWC